MGAGNRRPALRLRLQEVPEAEVLKAALHVCSMHRAVAWACRMNSGASRFVDKRGRERFVRWHTMPGMSDIVGQTVDGRFMALECKRAGEQPTADQARFLELVAQSGGVAGVVRNPQDVLDILAAAGATELSG